VTKKIGLTCWSYTLSFGPQWTFGDVKSVSIGRVGFSGFKLVFQGSEATQMFKKLFELILVASSLLIALPAPTQAAVGDPVITVTKSRTVAHVGQIIRFTATVTGGTQVPRAVIRYTNPLTHSTINIAQLGTGTKFKYTPTAADLGRVLTFVATIYVPASGHLVRPISASIKFKVEAAL
jgi:hypothetical protein